MLLPEKEKDVVFLKMKAGDNTQFIPLERVKKKEFDLIYFIPFVLVMIVAYYFYYKYM